MPADAPCPAVGRRPNPPRPRLFSRGIWLLPPGLALLGGCATYQPQPLSASGAAAAFEVRTLDDPALRQFAERNGAAGLAAAWLPAFWDLRRLTLAAFFRHADIEVARAKLAAAEAALVTAGVRPNPTVGFSPTFDVNPANGVSPWTLGFTLDLPIETAGKRGYRIAQAQQLANSARLNLAATVWQVRSRVRKSLAELEGATVAREILARQLAVQNQAVGLLEARVQAGESSFTEVQLVRVAAAQVALDLDEAEKQTAQARIRLAAALGVPAAALMNTAFSFADLDRLPGAEEAAAARRAALLNRADVLGALSDYDASQSALQLEVAQQYPDVHLGPGYAWDQGQNKFTLGLALALPVFNRHRGPIAEAAARRREAAAAFAAVQARASGEIELAIAGYRDALRKLATADALLAGQRQRLKSLQESRAAGAIDRVEELQAQAELGLGERAHAAVFQEAQLALGALEDAMQRPADSAGTVPVPVALLNRNDPNP